jgi:hypothetical protein
MDVRQGYRKLRSRATTLHRANTQRGVALQIHQSETRHTMHTYVWTPKYAECNGFGGICRLYLQDLRAYQHSEISACCLLLPVPYVGHSSNLKMEETRCSRTSDSLRTTRCHNPQNRMLQMALPHHNIVPCFAHTNTYACSFLHYLVIPKRLFLAYSLLQLSPC